MLSNVKSPSSLSQARFGFALPDLLVILAGLSILATIAIPLLVKNQGRARKVQCMSNLNQVNRAVLLYAEENQGTLPALPEKGKDPVWWFYKELVKGHAGLKDKSSAGDKVFACPEDRGYTDPLPFWKNSRFDYSSYVFNGVNLPGIPNLAGKKVNSIKEPTKTLLTMEWTAHAPLSWHNSRTGKKNVPFYNNAESMVGLVDGSVKFLPIYFDGIDAAFTRDPIPGYDYRWSAE
jgi:type II secretory pathway pseudopilin PulG